MQATKLADGLRTDPVAVLSGLIAKAGALTVTNLHDYEEVCTASHQLQVWPLQMCFPACQTCLMECRRVRKGFYPNVDLRLQPVQFQVLLQIVDAGGPPVAFAPLTPAPTPISTPASSNVPSPGAAQATPSPTPTSPPASSSQGSSPSPVATSAATPQGSPPAAQSPSSPSAGAASPSQASSNPSSPSTGWGTLSSAHPFNFKWC